jgi:hypothetical protein
MVVEYPNLDSLPSQLLSNRREPAYTASSPGRESLGSFEYPLNSTRVERIQEPLDPLSTDQERVLSLVKEGHNVFFTGPAGSGKSHILNHIQRYLDTIKKSYAVTAPTGIAAVLVGGQTIHSWSKVGRGEKAVSFYIKKARSTDNRGGSRSQKRPESGWKQTKVLIIDEISMVRFLVFCSGLARKPG